MCPPRTFPLLRCLLPAALLFCGLWIAVASAAERSARFRAAMESIQAGDLAEHVGRLADDTMEGREGGTRGGRAAANYLAGQFGKFGLRPAGAAGTAAPQDGGFFQSFAPNLRNVLAMREGSDPKLKEQVVVVGAHYDHVGRGNTHNSRGPVGAIHPGADDNASGTSALLELAQAFALLPEAPRRSILFVAFDGEEQGLLGSKHFAAHPTVPLSRVAAMLNIDMVGRLRNDKLSVFGSRTGFGLRRAVCQQNDESGLKLDFSWELSDEADHYPFFARNIPVLMFHTGLHDEYHTPRDTAKLIDTAGETRVARLAFALLYDLAQRDAVPPVRKAAAKETEDSRKRVEAAAPPRLPNRFGVTAEAGEPSDDGVRVTRILASSPAERAKLQVGDRIVRFDGREIRTLDDLLGAVRAAESPTLAVVRRGDQPEPLEIAVRLDGPPLKTGVTWRTDDAEPGVVIVTQVVPGSPAAAAGIRPGDRICQVAGTDFRDGADFSRKVATPADLLELTVERSGQVRRVELQIRPAVLPKAA
jgi:hypothetical protein